MPIINIHAAKTHFSRFVEAAAAGQEIIIAKAGKPAARLLPLAEPSMTRRFGALKGQIVLADDFDTPLPEAVLSAFEGQ